MLETLGKTGFVETARKVVMENEQGEWFEQLLKRNPSVVNQAKQGWRTWLGPYSTRSGALDKYLSSSSYLATSLKSGASGEAAEGGWTA